MSKLIHWNGSLVPVDAAGISPLDHGFLYGHGLFETLRVYEGYLFAFSRHYRRLQTGAEFLGWPALPSVACLGEWVEELLQANSLTDAAVRITLSRGSGAPRPDPTTCGELTVVIFAQEFQPPAAAVYQQGWSLKTTDLRRNPSSPLCRLKSANYLENILAKQEASRYGAREALFLNTTGMVAEGTMSNIFFVEAGGLVTPDLTSGLLPGITREIIMELAREAGMGIGEEKISPERAIAAQEIFLTSSLMEIMPVTCWDGRLVGAGVAGPVTMKLQHLYQSCVKESIAAKDFDGRS